MLVVATKPVWMEKGSYGGRDDDNKWNKKILERRTERGPKYEGMDIAARKQGDHNRKNKQLQDDCERLLFKIRN